MKSLFAILFGLLCGSAGYSAGVDESWIYDRLLKSPRFLAAKSLCEKGHVPLICMIEATTTESADVYIGEDAGDHANRITTARVFRNGTVKYLSYDANGEDQWITEDPTPSARKPDNEKGA